MHIFEQKPKRAVKSDIVSWHDKPIKAAYSVPGKRQTDRLLTGAWRLCWKCELFRENFCDFRANGWSFIVGRIPSSLKTFFHTFLCLFHEIPICNLQWKSAEHKVLIDEERLRWCV